MSWRLAIAVACASRAEGCTPIRVVHVDRVAMCTVTRLWHDQHVERKMAHDFSDLFAPEEERNSLFFVGASVHDVLRAIAVCERDDAVRPSSRLLRSVAHGPDMGEAADQLVRRLARRGYAPHPRIGSRQPRWAVALSYHGRGKGRRG